MSKASGILLTICFWRINGLFFFLNYLLLLNCKDPKPVQGTAVLQELCVRIRLQLESPLASREQVTGLDHSA